MCQNCTTFIADVIPTEDAPSENSCAMTTPLEAPLTIVKEPGAAPGDATVRMPTHLTLLDEKGNTAFTCEVGEMIGRNGAGAEYLGNIPTVSRQHCKVALEPVGWVLIDNNSTNGTWVNGQRISAPAHIKDGDIVLLSQACRLKVKL